MRRSKPVARAAQLRVPRTAAAIALLAALAARSAASDGARGAAPESNDTLRVGDHERLLVVAPHPDDEVLGAGGLVQRVLARGGAVQVVWITAGDGFPRGVAASVGHEPPVASDFLHYGRQRLREARAVAHILGAGELQLRLLGFPDGNLLPLLSAHWQLSRPLRSPTTQRHRVPYPDALQPNLAYTGSNLRAALTRLLHEAHPSLLAFPDPADEHPDHHAVGMFSLLAAHDALRHQRHPSPKLLGYLVHWHGWPPDSADPSAIGARDSSPLSLPDDLPARGLVQHCVTLSQAEVQTKSAALAAYATQQAIMPAFLAAFVRSTECFSLHTAANAAAASAVIRQTLKD